MDRLVDAEGAEPIPKAPDTKTDEDVKEEVKQFNSGKDLTKEIAKEMGVDQSEEQSEQEDGQEAYENQEEEGKEQKQKKQEPKKEGEAQQTQEWWNNAFNELQGILGEDFKVPEGLTKENAVEKLADVFYENADFSEVLHPNVIKMQELVNSHKGDFNQALNEYNNLSNWRSMSDLDLIKFDLKNSYGMDDQKVEEAVSNVNEKYEAAKVRQKYEYAEHEYLQVKKQNQQQLTQKQIEDMNKSRDAEINETLGKFKNKTEVYGVPIEAKHREGFPEQFKRWVTPDQEGVAPIAKLLHDNDQLADLIFFIENKTAIKDHVFREKNKTKEELKSKLDPELKMPKKNVQSHKEQEVDLDALNAPAQD